MLTQISVFLPDKPGILAKFIKLLMDNKIFIRAMTIAKTSEYGLLLILVDKPKECIELLEDKDYVTSTTEVIGIKLSDNPNALYDVPKTLGDNEINIEYLYSTLVKDEAFIVLRADDNEKAVNILTSNGFSLIINQEN